MRRPKLKPTFRKSETDVRTILLDAGPLAMLITGATGPDAVAQNRRLSDAGFEQDDYARISTLLAGRTPATTPHVIAEAANLLNKGGDQKRRQALGAARVVIVKALREVAVSSAVAANHSAFLATGLADAGLLEAATEDSKSLIITTDQLLRSTAGAAGIESWGLAELRQ